jgi:hypothetical protein
VIAAPSDTCVGRPVDRPTIVDPPQPLVRSCEREIAPYFPFTVSDRGARQHEGVLANDIGEDDRRGLAHDRRWRGVSDDL